MAAGQQTTPEACTTAEEIAWQWPDLTHYFIPSTHAKVKRVPTYSNENICDGQPSSR